MDRPTKKITAPSGVEVEMKTFVTARERNQLRSVMLDHMKFDPSNASNSAPELSGTVLELSEKKLVEVIVVSLAGSKESILDRLLDGTPEDYDFVVVEAGKVNTGFTPAK